MAGRGNLPGAASNSGGHHRRIPALLLVSSLGSLESSFAAPRDLQEWRFAFDFDRVLLLVQDQRGYRNLCRLVSTYLEPLGFDVTAVEGRFAVRNKTAGHPHTNMAKAALNMMTRTSSGEMFETDSILMTAVDTGWITDERPHHEKLRIAAEGWHAPLDLVDGAARVYDPIVLGESGTDLFGCFVKDYQPSPW